MTRALRRHHRERVLQRVRSYRLAEHMPDKRVRQLVATRTPCSCEMCCNMRKIDGPTLQERRFMCEPANPQE